MRIKLYNILVVLIATLNVGYSVYTTLLQCASISTSVGVQVACEKTFTVGGGTILHIFNCNTYCTGDTRIFLYDGSASLIKSDDDGCGVGGSCSSFTYTIPSSTAMQTYTVKMDCFKLTCTGSVQIEITGIESSRLF
jgi:hypothetical protein